MSTLPQPKPIDRCWMMFFRNALQPDRSWHAWVDTAASTQSGCIDLATAGFGGMWNRDDYRRLRRRGVVRCARATIYADLPTTGGDDGEE